MLYSNPIVIDSPHLVTERKSLAVGREITIILEELVPVSSKNY